MLEIWVRAAAISDGGTTATPACLRDRAGPSEQQAGRDVPLAGHERHAHAWLVRFANQGRRLGG